MKVLHITLRADTGGGPEHIRILARNLPEFIESHIACPKQEPYWEIYRNIVNGRLYEIPYRKFRIASFVSLLAYCKKEKIDIIHTHGRGAGLYGRLCSMWLNLPLIHTPHGIHLQKRRWVKYYLYVLYEKFTQRWLDCVIFVSESEREKARLYGLFDNIKYAIVNNGVESYSDLSHKFAFGNRLREFFRIPPEAPVCITLTRFSPEKNVPLILDIASQCKDTYFLIFGDGPSHSSVTKRVDLDGHSNVRIPGITSSPKDFLIGSDIYLSTSVGEGMPLSILEAMSCGLPIVASRVSGHVDCVRQGETGFLFDLNDIESATEAIRKLSVDSDLRRKLGVEGRDMQQKYFSIDVMVSGVVNQYASIG